MKKMRYREAKAVSLLLVRTELGFKYKSVRCKSPCPLLSADTDPGFGGHINDFGRFRRFGVSGSLLRRPFYYSKHDYLGNKNASSTPVVLRNLSRSASSTNFLAHLQGLSQCY